jgi:putative chitinase
MRNTRGTSMLTLDLFQKHWPHCPPDMAAGIVQEAPVVFRVYEINTALRQAHFLAQISHECGAGTELVESLNYVHAQRIMAVWPSRFATYDKAEPFVCQPEKLADCVYNGRMGNKAGSSDGWDFRGRGLLQITGHDSYMRVGTKCGINLVAKPDLAVDPKYALEIAAVEFEMLGAIKYADRDNLIEVSAVINVGHIVVDPRAIEGLSSREAWLKVWKHELGV